jgi:hypothetical protein
MLLKELKLTEAKSKTYQVKIGDTWEDRVLHAESLADIARAVTASPRDEAAHNKFDLGELTEIVTEYIGENPGGRREGPSVWDEMDFDLTSEKDDVLKISYVFSGIDRGTGRHKGHYMNEITKKGTITIMPGN